jgi:hypothetical protein
MAPTFAEALGIAERQARTALPYALHERLSCALSLLKNGKVFQTTSGAWQVQSVSEPERSYTTNGTCQYADMHYNKTVYFKHQLAMYLAQRVHTLMAQPPAPEVLTIPEEIELTSPDNDWPADEVPAPPAVPAPLPEAPVSITLKATLHGHEVMVTLRGTDFASVKAQVEEASAWLKAHAPEPPAQPSEGWCHKHKVSMKQTTKEGRSWWSHKTVDGWCQGR